MAIDLPGHGRSEGPALTSIGDMANWLFRLLNAVGIDFVAVVGHSMGSLIALEFSARHPECVTTAVLLSTAVPMAVSEELLSAAKVNDHDAIDMITIWGHGPGAQLGGHKAPGLWMTGSAERLLEQAADGVLYTDLSACNDYQDGLDAASRVQCPVLMVMGRDDLMTPPRAARGLTDVFPEAQTVIIEGCGHMMMMEKPDQVLDTLKEAI